MRGFTLIEVLIAIGVVMVLSVAVLLVLNPFELRRQAQDAARVSDLRTLEESMNFALSSAALTGQVFDSDGPNFPDDSCDGQANQRVFVSVPSDNGEVTSTLPSGWVWQQVARADLRKTDGNGWLPVNFQGYAGAGLSALQALPVDPTNTFASGLYYSYVCGSYEINAALASQKYRTKLLAHDGGDDNELLEIGSKLVIAPVRPSQGAPPSTAPSVSSITPSSGENTGLVNITNISGQNFQGSSTVKLAKSGQLDITGVGFSVPNSTTMSGGAFNLNGAATGPWDVVVTNPDAQFGTLVGGFTVTNPPSFDFSLSNAGNRSVVQGSSVTSTITATLVSSPTQAVSFTASGLPAGASASFGPASCSPTCNTTMTITASSSTPTGNSTITVTGTGGSVVRTTSFTLTVTAASDTTPPTVAMTAPANGATVSSTIAVSATASDNVGVVGVQFLLDGASLGTEDTVSPYSISWDTTSATNGSHTLAARARDAAGNQTTSTAITVNVDNPVFDFSLSNAGNRSVVQGSSVTSTITATLVSSPTQSVSFTASGLPAGASASFGPTSCSPTCNTTITLTASSSTPTGNSTITVTGTGGSVVRTTSFTLTVQSASSGFTDNFDTNPFSPARWVIQLGNIVWDSINLEFDIDEPGSGSGPIFRYIANSPGTVEHESQITALFLSSNSLVGPGVRMANTGANDAYGLRIDPVGVTLFRYNAGARSNLGFQSVPVTITSGNYYTMRLAARGAVGSAVTLNVWMVNHGPSKPTDPGWIGVDGSPDLTFTDTAVSGTRLDGSQHTEAGISGRVGGGTYDDRTDYFKVRAITY